MKYIIINVVLFLLVLCDNCYSQPIDTIAFKKDIESLLKKYKLSNSGYKLVVSENQKGGQTAFIISNNYSPNARVINGPNYGVNGDVYTGSKQRHINDPSLQNELKEVVKNIPNKVIPIQFISIRYEKEIENLMIEIAYYMQLIGFKTFLPPMYSYVTNPYPDKSISGNMANTGGEEECYWIIVMPASDVH